MTGIAFALLLLAADGEENFGLAVGGDCGVQSTYVAAIACGSEPGDYATFGERFGPPASPFGMTMAQMKRVVQDQGLHAVGTRLDLDGLRQVLDRPSGKVVPICHLIGSHFVVAQRVTDEEVTYVDPPDTVTVPTIWFANHWTEGNVLLVSARPIELPGPGPAIGWWLAAAAALVVVGGLCWRLLPDSKSK